MELIDLISGFDLNKLKDSDLKKVSRGVAMMLVTRPVLDASAKDTSVAKSVISQKMNACMHQIIDGNILSKIKMIAEVRKNMKAVPDHTQTNFTDVDVRPMLAVTKDMHIHHMHEEDYQKIADEFSRLAMEGLPLSSDNPLSDLTANASDKIYTAIKLALNEKDTLIKMAQESKNRAQK